MEVTLTVQSWIDRGLAIDRRLCSFEVVVSDRPGGISELTQIISQQGARYIITFNTDTDNTDRQHCTVFWKEGRTQP